jgi:site-specific DNA recombinase
MYADALPLDLLKKEQQRISAESRQITRRLEQLDTMLVRAETEIEKAVRLASVAAGRYARYSPETRRRFNKGLFDAIYFEDKRAVRFDWADAIAPVMRTADALASGSIKTRLVERTGIEPVTSGLQSRRSPS